jgi:acyl carrier protein
MIDSQREIVRRAVASYLDVDPAGIRPGQRLHRDLALHPLDVALIMLDIEEMEEVELPIDHLNGVETVSDLIHLLRQARDGERREGADRKVEHLPVSRSGAIRIVDLIPEANDERPLLHRTGKRGR